MKKLGVIILVIICSATSIEAQSSVNVKLYGTGLTMIVLINNLGNV